jgi:hypothetical protein
MLSGPSVPVIAVFHVMLGADPERRRRKQPKLWRTAGEQATGGDLSVVHWWEQLNMRYGDFGVAGGQYGWK